MNNTHPPIVNFPRLHTELTPEPKPENTVFLASALRLDKDTSPMGPSSHPAFIDTVRAMFPIPLKEARENARRLQEYGAELWESKQLATLAVMSRNQASDEKRHATELEEIKNFIASQGKASVTEKKSDASKTGPTTVLIGKEMALCIAYDLEEAVIDTKNALEKLGQANASFISSLHDEDEPEATYEAITALENFTSGTNIHLSYRSILDALLPFIPQETILFTNDREVLETLQDAGIFEKYPSSPCTNIASLQKEAHFNLITLPAWELLRLQSPNDKLPWTTRTVTLCYPPAKTD